MTQSRYLIIGQGDIGLPVSNQLARNGLDVTGLARSARDNYDLHPDANYLQADALKLTAEQIMEFTHILIIVTPDSYNADNYQQTYFGIAKHLSQLEDQLPQLERIVFISSTGVYGQDRGEWIDETSKPEQPQREASRYILQAEEVLQSTFGERTAIIRPSGIYGKERTMRIRKAQEDNKEAMPKYAWTNRIMDTDLVTVIIKVLTIDKHCLKPMYIATDFRPVTSYILTKWLCEELATTLPTLKDTFQLSGKRLHSNVPLNWLNYPDWQIGYSSILNSK